MVTLSSTPTTFRQVAKSQLVLDFHVQIMSIAIFGAHMNIFHNVHFQLQSKTAVLQGLFRPSDPNQNLRWTVLTSLFLNEGSTLEPNSSALSSRYQRPKFFHLGLSNIVLKPASSNVHEDLRPMKRNVLSKNKFFFRRFF